LLKKIKSILAGQSWGWLGLGEIAFLLAMALFWFFTSLFWKTQEHVKINHIH